MRLIDFEALKHAPLSTEVTKCLMTRKDTFTVVQ
jgi:hypothetical protein